jgi:hypothetical protein
MFSLLGILQRWRLEIFLEGILDRCFKMLIKNLASTFLLGIHIADLSTAPFQVVSLSQENIKGEVHVIKRD